MVRNTLFIKSSFLLGFHSGFHFTKKVYFVKPNSRMGEEWRGWDGMVSHPLQPWRIERND
jgi:hypothetical protein